MTAYLFAPCSLFPRSLPDESTVTKFLFFEKNNTVAKDSIIFNINIHLTPLFCSIDLADFALHYSKHFDDPRLQC